MKIRILKSYYSKLTLFSLTLLSAIALLTIMLGMYYLQDSQVSERMSEHDSCMQELIQEYEDIHKRYYKVFQILCDTDNAEYIAALCKSKTANTFDLELYKKINQILRDACREDERIVGLYLHTFSNDARYMYSANDKNYTISNNEPGGIVEENQRFQRIVIGARSMTFGSAEAANVFGIQSGVLKAGEAEKASDYQLVVFYSLDQFDQIIEKHQIDSDARFLLTTVSGEIIYDSQGNYADDEVSYYESDVMFTGDGKEVVGDTHFYLKRKSYKSNMYLALYTMSENSMHFQFDQGDLMIILVTMVVYGLITLILLMFHHLLKKRFEAIECGMEQIGKNKLDYRMHVAKKEDEFTRIAISFNKMCDDLKEAINQNYVYEIQRQKAEYKALQGIVNPHFLYNSLETIREKLMIDGQEDCSEMIILLSRIFEYQIRGDSIVSVRTELGSLQTYMEFNAIRYQYGFEYSIDFDEEILDCMIPKLVFQPILENYFVHGLRCDGNDCIRIRGHLDKADDRIHVSFCDNGKGMTKEQAKRLCEDLREKEQDSSHIGLCNVNSRLKIAFGNDGYVDIKTNEPEPGVSISLIFGKRMERKEWI